MLNKISIIYNTCDKYESLWNGFFTLWDRYWPDCKNRIVLNSETKHYSFGNLNIVSPVENNTTCSWSQRLINSINNVSTEYVLLVLDDFYIKAPVKLDKLEKCVQYMENDSDIQLFTYGWQPGPNKDDNLDTSFELRGRFAKYRVNAQIGLWRVSYLRKILKTYENPWQFELNGSFRSSLFGGKIYALKKGAPLVFDYDWGFLIVRGKVNNKIREHFVKNEKLTLDLPFDTFVEEEYCPPKGNKVTRMIRYAGDMVASLFKE